jgi:hypothetical protein
VTPEINAVETLYNAQGALKAALGATPVEQPRISSASAEGKKTCKHGEMTFRNGSSAKDLGRVTSVLHQRAQQISANHNSLDKTKLNTGYLTN